MSGLIEAALRAEQTRRAAMLAGDIPAQESLLSERLVYVHANAVREDKQAYLERVRSGDYVYLSIETEDPVCAATEDTVVISTRRTVIVCPPPAKEPLKIVTLATDVWTVEEGTMRLLAYHGTFCADPVPA